MIPFPEKISYIFEFQQLCLLPYPSAGLDDWCETGLRFCPGRTQFGFFSVGLLLGPSLFCAAVSGIK